jgi:hypothetical protein
MPCIIGFTLAFALASSDPTLDAARAELSAVAERIAQLKNERLQGRATGRELERLLVRAQELAEEIDERSAVTPAPAAVAPSAEELRERADALHDEADRLAAALTDLDVRIAGLRRTLVFGPGRGFASVATVRHAAAGSTGRAAASPLEMQRLHQLLVERDALAARLRQVRAAAAATEAEARAAER